MTICYPLATARALIQAMRFRVIAIGLIGLIGLTIGTVVSPPSCAHSIFTFEIATQRRVEFASIPWLVTLEGNRPMDLENARDRSE